jgi:hypothetical protein
MHTEFLQESLKEGDHLEDSDAERRIILKLIINKYEELWILFVWLKIRISCSCEHSNNFQIHKMQAIT